MIERRPGSWTGSGRIAAWYTPVSASSSATKASRLSSRSGIEQCTAASVCQAGPVRACVRAGGAGVGPAVGVAPEGAVPGPGPSPASRPRGGEPGQPPFCRTPLVTSNSDPIGWTLDRISVRMIEKNGAGRIPHLAPPAGRDVGKRPARPGRDPLSRAGGGQAPLIGGSAVSTTATPAEVRPGMNRSDARPRCRVAPSAMALLESARYGLAAAEGEVTAGGRYREAHLAALRAAAAVVAAKADPGASSRRRRPLSVWELLPKVEPALAEWAAFFAAGAAKRAAAEAGLPRAVSLREADDLLRDAETFVSLAENALGVPAQPLLPLLTAG